MVLFSPHATRRTASAAHRPGRGHAWLLALAAAWSLPADAQPSPWRTLSDRDGIRTESRRIPGHPSDELRISTSLKASPEAVAGYLFGQYLDEKNKNIDRRFVQRGPELTVWSDVLSLPMAGERCYSMRFERQALAGGEIRVKFASLAYIGDTPRPGCIALRSRGEWVMTPTASGTRLSYLSLTDIGGNLPAMLTRRSLSSVAVSSLRKVAAGASGLKPPKGVDDQ